MKSLRLQLFANLRLINRPRPQASEYQQDDQGGQEKHNPPSPRTIERDAFPLFSRVHAHPQKCAVLRRDDKSDIRQKQQIRPECQVQIPQRDAQADRADWGHKRGGNRDAGQRRRDALSRGGVGGDPTRNEGDGGVQKIGVATRQHLIRGRINRQQNSHHNRD